MAILESDRSIAEILSSRDADLEVELDALPSIRNVAWTKYVAERRVDATRLTEHRDKQITIGDAVMRYESFVIGDRPADGYPLYIALHGGGGAPPAVNDQQWQHMQVYYRDSVMTGVYVAPRGMANTYNLHSVGPSYPAYDRLIENMILFEGVDPNRVYFLGFSAGGDGVYQIAPRMADRLAAVNMSAGHPNGVSLINVYQLPFLLQVGQRDTAYNRHRVTAEYAQYLEMLQQAQSGGYVYQANIHVDRPHNFKDNDAAMGEYEVLADPIAWLESGTTDSTNRNTNAIAWLNQHTRNPLPARIIWEPAVRADSRLSAPLLNSGQQARVFYWLGMSDEDCAAYRPGETIIARIDSDQNAIIVEQLPHGTLEVLLNEAMFDLSEPISVTLGEQTHQETPKVTLGSMLRSLISRGDPSFSVGATVQVVRSAAPGDQR